MADTTEKTFPPLKGASLAIGTVALSLAAFLFVLDTTIANVSLTAISGDLGVSPTQGTWVITFFSVANAITVPLTGWLARRIGQVRLCISSILLFVTASFLCGIAPNIVVLIACRIFQGAVCGPLASLSQTLLLQSYPKERAGSALAAWAITILVAPIMGPIVGGWITDNFSWPWIFFINVPIGLLAATMIWSIYRTRESTTFKDPIDKVGLALLILWVGALQVMLDKGKELDWFGSPFIVFLAVVALVGFAFFIAWELTERHPVVDLMLFKRRNFATIVPIFAVAVGLYFGTALLLPLWLQTQLGYTATWAGLALAPAGILAIVFSPVTGRIVARHDPRILITCGMIVFSACSFMRGRFNAQVDFAHIALPTFIQGLGTAMFFVPLTTLMLSGIPQERIASAAGLSNFARNVASAFSASITATLWDSGAASHHARLSESISVYNPATQQTMQSLAHSGMSPEQAHMSLERLINGQAYLLSTIDFFNMSGWLFLALPALIWFTKPPKRNATVVAADAGH